MTIKKRTGLEIEQVANGFIVRPARQAQMCSAPMLDEVHVFPNLGSLGEFMEEHFDVAPGKPIGAKQ